MLFPESLASSGQRTGQKTERPLARPLESVISNSGLFYRHAILKADLYPLNRPDLADVIDGACPTGNASPA
jgi:hypothetical protein